MLKRIVHLSIYAFFGSLLFLQGCAERDWVIESKAQVSIHSDGKVTDFSSVD